MTDITVTVVIVSYQSAALTIDCLHSIRAELDVAGIKIYVVVVDNASGDAPAISEEVEQNHWNEWVSVLTAPRNGGFAYGNNVGFEYALRRGPVDYFHLLNPDTVLRAGAIAELVKFMQSCPEAGIAGSSFENSDGSLWPIAFRFPSVLSELAAGVQLNIVSRVLRPWVVPVPMEQKNQPIDWVAGASMMLRRSAVEQLRGFDEGYFLYYEETDLCLRAKRAGWSTWYVPASRVMHIAGQSTKVTEREARPKRLPSYLFESRRRYFVKNYGLAYFMIVDLVAILAAIAGAIKRSVMGNSEDGVPCFISDMVMNSVIFSANRRVGSFCSRL